jgi:hypothetical protein
MIALPWYVRVVVDTTLIFGPIVFILGRHA